MWEATLVVVLSMSAAIAIAQATEGVPDVLSGLVRPHDYVPKRASSYDRSGGNDDFRKIPARLPRIYPVGGPGNAAK
jgi:hypothetical protein